MTELPMSFHWGVGSLSNESLSHAIWRLPVMVRSGSSASVWICGSGNGASVVTISVAVVAQVEQVEVGERPPGQSPEEPRPVPGLGGPAQPHRHPLVVHALGAGLALQVVALVGLVVLRARAPGVVGDLVVVPRDDERVAPVQPLQVGVGLVLRVPASVVGQAHDLAGRLTCAAAPPRRPLS